MEASQCKHSRNFKNKKIPLPIAKQIMATIILVIMETKSIWPKAKHRVKK